MPGLLAGLGATALVALLVLLGQAALASHDGAAESSDQRVIRILASIAGHQSHGWSDDGVPLRQLEADLARGQRIAASCGTVVPLAVRAAHRAGYQARIVGSFTRQPLNGDDGHTMTEVRLSKGWTVFDLDNNRMAPPGVGISELVRAPRWRVIAHDAPYDKAEIAASNELLPNDPLGPAYYRGIFTDLGAWYHRVLGVPLIYHNGFWFHDAAERERGLSLGYRWASAGRWRKLNR